METEASREALRKELANLNRKMAELEDDVMMKEREHALTLEDSRRNEKKLDEQVRADMLFIKHFIKHHGKIMLDDSVDVGD